MAPERGWRLYASGSQRRRLSRALPSTQTHTVNGRQLLHAKPARAESRVAAFGVPQEELPLICLAIWTQFRAEPLWDEVFSDCANNIYVYISFFFHY